MATIAVKGNTIHTASDLPTVHSLFNASSLVAKDLSEKSIDNYKGKRLVLNIFPSVDTGTCAMSVRHFNQDAAKLNNTVVLCISKDLPFAQARFCGAEGIENVEMLSAFRTNSFDFLNMIDGPLKGLTSRVVMVLNEKGEVLYTEQVADIVDEPNYENALNALK